MCLRIKRKYGGQIAIYRFAVEKFQEREEISCFKVLVYRCSINKKEKRYSGGYDSAETELYYDFEVQLCHTYFVYLFIHFIRGLIKIVLQLE